MEVPFIAVSLMIGFSIGFVFAGVVSREIRMADRARLNAVELFGWTVAQSNGRWAVLKDTNSEMKVIGTTQPTLRLAIDAAVQIERKA